MPGDEHELVAAGSLCVPFQVMLGMDRLPVFVDAEKREVEVVAGIGEVIGIAAKKCRLLFRREHEADIGVLLIPIKPILRSLIQGYDVEPNARQPKMVEPLVRQREPVTFLNRVRWRTVERPHAFVGVKRRDEEAKHQEHTGAFHIATLAGTDSAETPCDNLSLMATLYS